MKTDTINKNWLGQKIVGTWELVSWRFKDKENNEIDFFGTEPKGILMYMDSGYMSVQIARSDRENFTDPGFNGGSQLEQANAFNSFFAYFGKYKEIDPGVFEHTVGESLFPNWKGDIHVRIGELKGDLLILSTPKIAAKNTDTIFLVTWRKRKKTGC